MDYWGGGGGGGQRVCCPPPSKIIGGAGWPPPLPTPMKRGGSETFAQMQWLIEVFAVCIKIKVPLYARRLCRYADLGFDRLINPEILLSRRS